MGENSEAVKNGLNATVQGISGTGSLRIGGAFLANFFPGAKDIYLPSPTWGNHIPLFKHSGLNVKTYRYYEPETCGLDFKGALEDINVSNNHFNNPKTEFRVKLYLIFITKILTYYVC